MAYPSFTVGDVLFCNADNISTDALYPGRLTYQDDVSQEEMAQACMETYDPSFNSIARPNDILLQAWRVPNGVFDS